MYHHINAVTLLVCYGLIIYGIIDQDPRTKWIYILTGSLSIFIYPVIFELVINLLAKIFRCKENIETHSEKHSQIYKKKIPIAYSEDYNITACGIEKFHPFDSCKYRGVFSGIVQSSNIKKELIYEPEIPSRAVLLEVMNPCHLLLLNYSLYLSKCVEMPICFLPAEFLRYRLLNPMMLAVDGTLASACMALEHGWSINLSGGYHHASRGAGGGFCIYPDITFAVDHLRKWHFDRVKKVMIIDLDAHQGNGHERDFLNDADVFILDCYNPRIYPGDDYARDAIKKEVLVSYRHSDEEYISLVQKALRESIDLFRPDFIIYNAGTDCMMGDPLGNLNISAAGIVKRDEVVFSEAFSTKIPILMLLSGGYQKVNAPTIVDSIINLINKFNLK